MNPLKYNRYTYVLNNPLKYTDPSGYKYQYDRYKWESSWEEGAAMYYQMAAINQKALYYSYGGGGMGGYSQMEKAAVDPVSTYSDPNTGKQYDVFYDKYQKRRYFVRNTPTLIYDPWVDARYTEEGVLVYAKLQFYQAGVLGQIVYQDKVAANGGDPQRELVATGVVTSIMLFAGGGVGIEAGTIKYKGEEYGILSVAVVGELDISGGWNFIKIYTDPNNFDIYNIEGAGGQGNASFTIIGGSWEAPSRGEQFTDQYRIKS